MRAVRWLCVMGAVVVHVMGQPTEAQSGFCLRDADHDGHPMFGNPQVRAGFELYNGAMWFSRAPAKALGDLDGDGDADALVINNWPHVLANPQLHFLTVHLNHGDGVFDPAAVPYPVGKEGTDVVLGDLDGDGDLDAAVPNARADSVSVVLNNGDATFAPHVEYGVGQMPRSAGIADLDGDGDFDLAVLNIDSDDVSILRNNGDGTFAPEARFFIGSVTPRGNPNLNFTYPGPFLAHGDLDGDGDIDVAAPSNSKVKVLLNNGQAGFSLAAAHPSVAGGSAYAVAVADLDGDADPDLAVISLGGVLSVILNTGGGAFAPPMAYNAGSANQVQFATSITAGDIEADGDLDLVVGHESGQHVMLMRNHGDATFAPKVPIRVFGGPWFVRLAELSGDGGLDLGVLSTSVRAKLCVLLNDGAGSVITDARYPAGGLGGLQDWVWLEGGDLDNDGDPDLVACTRNTEQPYHVMVMKNDGSGAFSNTPYALGPPGTATGESVSIGDLNADGNADLVVCDAIVPGGFLAPGKVWTMMGQGGGVFQAPVAYPLIGLIPQRSAIADLDADGDLDLAVWAVEVYPGDDMTPADRRVVLFENTGGVLTERATILIAAVPWPFPWGSVAVADFDHDGDGDLAATAGTKSPPGVLAVFENTGAWGFRLAQSFQTPAAPWSVLAKDMNRDGTDDLVLSMASIWNAEREYLHVYLNSGNGTLALQDVYHDPLGYAAAKVVVGEDRGDLVLALPNDVFAMVHRVRHDGLLLPRQNYGTGDWPTAVVLADFNGDDRLDLATSNDADSNVSVLLNRGCAPCYADCNSDAALTIADFGCFQTKFVATDPYADCSRDGQLTVQDFGCFQTRFVAGCP